jgi:heme-degrading monooxygenase HmoA
MFAVLWQYQVRPGAESAFEALYGAQGDWVALFRAHPGYLGTELLRGEAGGEYLSIDRWASQADYDAFLAGDRSRYAEIDARGDALTVSERRIGRYRAV